MFINPEDLPPEVRAELQAQHDRANMEAADRVHRVESFVYGLDQDNLFALSILLGQVLGSKVRTAYWQGQVDGLLQDRHNVCAVHGVDHEAQALESMTKGSTVASDKSYGPADLERDMQAAVASLLDDPSPEALERIAASVEEIDKVMQEYRLEYVEENDTFKCSDCGYGYPSIEDRIIKAPDDCPGCHVRAGQG